jgi:hypothetical protein
MKMGPKLTVLQGVKDFDMHRIVLAAIAVGGIVMLATPGARAANPFTELTTTGVGPGNYAAFDLGGTGSKGTFDNTGGKVTGNIGVAASGTIANDSGSTITGNIYESAAGQYSGLGGSLSGTTTVNATLMASNLTGATTASSDATALTATQTFASGISAATTITGVAGVNVIDVTGNISISSGNLTLNGPATAYFVINITGNITTSGSVSFLLTGGVKASDVLYNLSGTSANFSQSSTGTLNGIFLADGTSSQMNLGSGNIDGEIIGHDITADSGFHLTASGAIAEPSSLLVFGGGILALVPIIRRRYRSRVRAASLCLSGGPFLTSH